MSEHIHKSHNKSSLLYHFVCLIKYRPSVLTTSVSKIFKKICLQKEQRYEMNFLEIGFDGNHIHFLILGVPNDAPKKIIEFVLIKIPRWLYHWVVHFLNFIFFQNNVFLIFYKRKVLNFTFYYSKFFGLIRILVQALQSINFP
ncbi:MAG: transposase [Lutibacter sp.]